MDQQQSRGFTDFRNRSVVITGAGAGIGRVTALQLAELGARVAVGDLDGGRADAVASEIEEAHGAGRARAAACDVRDYGAVKVLIDDAIDGFGGVDVLINNAGTGTPALFVDSKPEDWNYDLGICLYGVLNGVHVVLPHMIERGGGRIVNCCSDAGRVGEPYLSLYSAAKAGVIGFTKAVAKEVGKQGIYVNCACFGTTMTELMQVVLSEERQQKMVKLHPLRRLGTMEDAANTVIMLASDRASFITGQVLSSSGGYTMVD